MYMLKNTLLPDEKLKRVFLIFTVCIVNKKIEVSIIWKIFYLSDTSLGAQITFWLAGYFKLVFC